MGGGHPHGIPVLLRRRDEASHHPSPQGGPGEKGEASVGQEEGSNGNLNGPHPDLGPAGSRSVRNFCCV